MAQERSLSFPTSLAGIPPSLSPAVIEASDDVEVELARSGLQQASETAERMRQAASALHADVSRPEPARHGEAKRVSEKAASATLTKLTGALQRLDATIDKLRNEVSGPRAEAGWLQSGRHVARINALASMPHERRRAVMLSALDAGDDLTVASILSEPSFVSGLEPNDVLELRQRWSAKNKSAEVARLARLEKARDHLVRGSSLLMQYAGSLFQKADAQEAQRLADAANAAISAALPPGA